ncbi:hypothetical protein [Leptolyngbya ohadii]|uniref:hypothetical protein n=1 Tax=Leptolyngbya ohadii TaxID=1962290 RepID=UPI000B5A1A88|nr:hypothetical protein [Leptolyngbya ohadii]
MFAATQGSARQRISTTEADRLRSTGTLITDDRHRRPFYFDGRFLAARDLTQEQNYFLTRQADLNRAAGVGVVRGLQVKQGKSGFLLQITAGHGVTPAGEMVMLANNLTLNVADVAEMQELDATFGLTRIPQESPRNRTGLFILALRAVEYTANPIASYPTTLDGARTVEDGDIIEAVAVTLIPYEVGAVSADRSLRSTIAHQIFVEGTVQGMPSEALPLAMIALENSVVRWIDAFLVRREVGAEHGSILGMGFAPRALREAHVLQYNEQLEDWLQTDDRTRLGQRISAASEFAALPAAGQMPASAINSDDFTQSYFPPGIDVELSFVPSDEIAVLVEESLLLPPIDLTLTQEELTSTTVLVLIPVTRQEFRQLQTSLPLLSQTLSPAAPDALTKTNPIDQIRMARLPRIRLPIQVPELSRDTNWRTALKAHPRLWFVRRRNFAYRTPPRTVRIAGNDRRSEDRLTDTVNRFGFADRIRQLQNNTTAIGNAEVVSFLSAPKLDNSRLLLGSAVQALEAAIPETPTTERPIDQAAVLQVAQRFGDPRLGEGIRRLEALDPQFKENETAINTLIETGAIPELDRVVRALPEAEAQTFAQTILMAAIDRNPQDITGAIARKLQEIPL